MIETQTPTLAEGTDSPANENLKVRKEMDDLWNTGNFKEFWEAHTNDVTVSASYLPTPTKGLAAHRKDVEALIAAFPDMKTNITLLFGQGDWIAAEYVMEGTHTAPFVLPGGMVIPATNKPVRVKACELSRMENGKFAEERVHFDLAGLMMQLGLMPRP